MSLRIDPVSLRTSLGGLSDLVSGDVVASALEKIDDELPAQNSLRRATLDSKLAVLVASDVLQGAPRDRRDRLGVYIGLQRMSLDYCGEFIATTYREGPRFASPLLFSESVANIAATHLSLTLGLRGIPQTFIGTRVAGIQAMAAAAEDLEMSLIDTAAVVVLGLGCPLTSDGYNSIFNPSSRHTRPKPIEFLPGAFACLVRRSGAPGLRLRWAGSRCFGASSKAAVESLLKDCDTKPERLLSSSLCVAPRPGIGERVDLPESLALDPFIQLLVDEVRVPDVGSRAVVCVGEEGTAGLLAVDRTL